MQDFKKLDVWKKSHKLTLGIYKTTASYPHEERFGIISQMRRCCTSIPSNIAEGCGRNSASQLLHFLNIASGSVSELEYQLILSLDLEFVDSDQYHILEVEVSEVKKMLWSLMQSVRKNTDNQELKTKN